MALVFSYGTLQQPSVQRAIFGRLLTGEADAVTGHELTTVTITDPAVISSSGSASHPMLVPSTDRSARVNGTVYDLDDEQLAASDAYEVADYHRIRLPLASGRDAWVYGLAAAPSPSAVAAADLVRSVSARLRVIPSLTGTAPVWDGDDQADPVALFATWLSAALDAGVAEPVAMTLSTVDAHGDPDARVLILKSFDAEGRWGFAGSADSSKAAQLDHTPAAALTVYWVPLLRSVRIRGRVRRAPQTVADADFAHRSRSAQAAALAGRSGTALSDRAEQADAVTAALGQLTAGTPIAHRWAVWWLDATSIEFWQGSPDRQHLRSRYTRSPHGWTATKLWA